MDYNAIRNNMVKQQIEARGIKDKEVIGVMRSIERHKLVPESDKDYAYDDTPLPIGCGQTISQPYIVALMSEMLEINNDNKVLEIGTGSGYQTAVLSRMALEVFTIEFVEKLSLTAKSNLEQLNIKNVHYKISDGSLGWPEFMPYNRIIVTAAVPEIPYLLEEQLNKQDGVLLIPVGNILLQKLIKVKYIKEKREIIEGTNVVFVPLKGQYGFK